MHATQNRNQSLPIAERKASRKFRVAFLSKTDCITGSSIGVRWSDRSAFVRGLTVFFSGNLDSSKSLGSLLLSPYRYGSLLATLWQLIIRCFSESLRLSLIQLGSSFVCVRCVILRGSALCSSMTAQSSDCMYAFFSVYR